MSEKPEMPDFGELGKAIEQQISSDLRSTAASVYTEIAHKFSGTVEKYQKYHEVINYCLDKAASLRMKIE